MNAVSKGISLGIFKKEKEKGLEASRAGSQPFVELMGRRWAFFSPKRKTCIIVLK
jgi:hypothetical protein